MHDRCYGFTQKISLFDFLRRRKGFYFCSVSLKNIHTLQWAYIQWTLAFICGSADLPTDHINGPAQCLLELLSSSILRPEETNL